jgi:hypothetical protein
MIATSSLVKISVDLRFDDRQHLRQVSVRLRLQRCRIFFVHNTLLNTADSGIIADCSALPNTRTKLQ